MHIFVPDSKRLNLSVTKNIVLKKNKTKQLHWVILFQIVLGRVLETTRPSLLIYFFPLDLSLTHQLHFIL